MECYVWKPCTCIDWTIFNFGFDYVLSNLQLKIIIYCVINLSLQKLGVSIHAWRHGFKLNLGFKSGGWGFKAWVTVFQVFLTIQAKTRAKLFLSISLRGYTIAVITPMRQASTYGQVLALDWLLVRQNSANGCSCQEFKSCHSKITTMTPLMTLEGKKN